MNKPPISYTYIQIFSYCFMFVVFLFHSYMTHHSASTLADCVKKKPGVHNYVFLSKILRSSPATVTTSSFCQWSTCLTLSLLFLPLLISLCHSPFCRCWFPERWVTKKQGVTLEHVLSDVILLSPDDN